MTDTHHKLTSDEIQNSITTLIAELVQSVDIFSGEKTALDQRKRLLCLAENAKRQLEMWGSAVGHTSWLASTHDEADSGTAGALGTISFMQGQFLSMTAQLDGLVWSVTHDYDIQTNTVTAIDLTR